MGVRASYSAFRNMNPNDANPESADQGRIGRVFVSSFILGLTLFGIMVASREQGVLFFYGVAAFLCYAFLSSFLIAWIAGRLFRQHEVREFKFDMANMILISVQLALPFAFANALWEIFQMELNEWASDARIRVLIVLAGIAAFLLLPIFYLTEAFLVWYSRFSKTKREEA